MLTAVIIIIIIVVVMLMEIVCKKIRWYLIILTEVHLIKLMGVLVIIMIRLNIIVMLK